jgi:hypothetical protein
VVGVRFVHGVVLIVSLWGDGRDRLDHVESCVWGLVNWSMECAWVERLETAQVCGMGLKIFSSQM